MKRQGYFASIAFASFAFLSSGTAWAGTAATHASGPNVLVLLASSIAGVFWLMTRRRKRARR